jgi:hypothetical protein
MLAIFDCDYRHKTAGGRELCDKKEAKSSEDTIESLTRLPRAAWAAISGRG